MSKETFHVYCKIRSTTHRITVMAVDKVAAQEQAEADGHEVAKVRRAPFRHSSFPRK